MTPQELKKLRLKIPLGDGLTAHYDGWQVVLERESGGSIDWVALDPHALVRLDRYLGQLGSRLEAIRLAREADEAVWSPEELERLKGEGLA